MSYYQYMAEAQFENVNALRSYPFSGQAAFLDRSGKEMPRDIIVDVHMAVPLGVESESSDGSSSGGTINDVTMPEVALSSVHVSPAMVSACFVSRRGIRSEALSVTVSRDKFVPYMPYMMDKLIGMEDVGGVVTFGDFEFPASPVTYFLDNATLHPCCVAAFRPPMLRRFIDRRSGESATGDVNISFSGYVSAAMDGESVRLSLNDGAGRELASECLGSMGSEACGATPISSINGVRPDEDGNIVLWFH